MLASAVAAPAAPSSAAKVGAPTATPLASPKQPAQLGERDFRQSLGGRAHSALITDLQALERLYQMTSDESPDKVQLLRRLAEACVELESAAMADRMEADRKIRDTQAKKLDSAELRNDYSAADNLVKASHAKAIAYYTFLTVRYPTYSKLDEAFYYLAYEYEQAQEYDYARAVYQVLIDKVPKSPYVPLAYLALGELCFNASLSDGGKWDLAVAAYRNVIKYPPPGNTAFGFGQYKLGYAYWNMGDYAHALNEFRKVIEFGQTYPDLLNARHLGAAARSAILPVYAEAGAPAKAFDFFRPLSGDGPGSTEKTVALLMGLGDAFRARNKPKEAVATYLQVLKRMRPGAPGVCDELPRALASLAKTTPGLTQLESRRAEVCR
jgi:tetratricopeptide (TPR) repeat protein